MELIQIQNYDDFLRALMEAGFSASGGGSEGFSLLPWGWADEPPYETPVRWHTEDKDTDPWAWRLRVVEEPQGIAYGKIFSKKMGFVTKAWVPYFLAARRGGKNFEEAYMDGTISHYAKRIYDVIEANGAVAVHDLKPQMGFVKEDKAVFDRSLVELQMKMYITVSGSRQRVSAKGEAYSWASTAFCTTEVFWGDEVFAQANAIDPNEAMEVLMKRVLELNPMADMKKARKFILG